MPTSELLVELTLSLSKSLLLVITGYTLISMIAALVWRLRRRQTAAVGRPVSILKPLHGDEPELYENLRSFCVQDYPDYQIVFGVHSEQDLALHAVERLRREFPRRDLVCVIDSSRHGSNHKVGNLINLYPQARYDWLVLADSDIRVGPDYLQRVTAPLSRPQTGIVTCLYRGRSLGGFWSRLGALFIDGWFTPAVLVMRLFGSSNFAFGSTIALRRETLQAIGGFQALTNYLADDFRLGELTRARGLQTVLSDYVVETNVSEPRAADLLRHELRWLRTIRAVQPVGYLLMFITFGLPLMLLIGALPAARPMALPLLGITLVARTVLHFCIANRASSSSMSTLLTLPLLPLRDAFSLCVWAIGFTSRRVSWAGHEFTVAEDGSFEQSTSSTRFISSSFRGIEHDHSEH